MKIFKVEKFIVGINCQLQSCCTMNNHDTDVKGGESSSQFRWFTIAKIEL